MKVGSMVVVVVLLVEMMVMVVGSEVRRLWSWEISGRTWNWDRNGGRNRMKVISAGGRVGGGARRGGDVA
jgi:hypothetical protein